jgi:hypothetical protein
MAVDDQTYFLRRAKEEEAAARAATNPVVSDRHSEFACVYRMRLLYVDREMKSEAAPTVDPSDSEPFIAAPESAPDHAMPAMKIFVR